MAYFGMARHDESSFNESTANRMLSEFLENGHKIKTFFKENDRTPNYDGTFELVNQDGTPTKQFIVQIKKVENLTPNKQGINKGKYMYSLETNFLYYVKEKVTESPAIYFIVDIATKNIFWLYLSDKLLMDMNFEGRTNLYYPLSEDNIIKDFDVFFNELKGIAANRNSLFLQKTSVQIIEMQDALDFINQKMDGDFKKIKEAVFPNLWRFGIKHSHSNTVSIVSGGNKITAPNAALFALYPQVKGVPDTGVHEYLGISNQFFNHWDMSGKTTPMEYVRNSLNEILKSYFEHGISFEYLPDIVLFEKLGWFVNNMSSYFDFKFEDDKICINSLYESYCTLINYLQHIIFDEVLNDSDKLLKAKLMPICSSNSIRHINIFHYLSIDMSGFREYCLTIKMNPSTTFSPQMLGVVTKDFLEAYLILLELIKRNVHYYVPVWDYDYFSIIKGPSVVAESTMNEICYKWFEELPAAYFQTYKALFDNEKYMYLGRFEYKNEYIETGVYSPCLTTVIRKYESEEFRIENNVNCSEEFNDEDNGLVSISSGLLFDRFIQRKTPIYDSVRCLVYQGICEALDLKCRGLSFGGFSNKIFW